ncbi:hypothetical protein [Aeromicrobium sp. IC_218]|uniref:hypothetical protein n=1 Tax=Aeromicrobium sp. IC_218 TaxID=2545468 RepID=UPI00103C0BEA|nr:hypothetical protein [Aeromicrobium sp. IC_218]TCI99784.1 hypothetical protein E0W78_05090 [Aeromicrobium sp. IC_218]
MPMTQRCDECRELFDPETEGALLLTVRRGVDADEWDDSWIVSGNRLDLRFCSQAHAAEHLATRELPHPAPEDEDEAWALSDYVGLIVMLTLLGCAGYGLYALVRTAWDLLL